jgi:hypothetical protein
MSEEVGGHDVGGMVTGGTNDVAGSTYEWCRRDSNWLY